jgi:hypothetical protein
MRKGVVLGKDGGLLLMMMTMKKKNLMMIMKMVKMMKILMDHYKNILLK